MGWVTLTLRKTELKRSHTDYQNELLQISRRKRQMAREYAFQQLQVRNQQSAAQKSLYDNYKTLRNSYQAGLSGLGSDGTITSDEYYITDSNGNLQNFIDDGNGSMRAVTANDQGASNVFSKTQLENLMNAAYEDYQFNLNNTKQDFEQQLEAIEQEANDAETDLDQQQVQVEAQLEAISAEIEAVGQAVSAQIQASTIKLA